MFGSRAENKFVLLEFLKRLEIKNQDLKDLNVDLCKHLFNGLDWHASRYNYKVYTVIIVCIKRVLFPKTGSHIMFPFNEYWLRFSFTSIESRRTAFPVSGWCSASSSCFTGQSSPLFIVDRANVLGQPIETLLHCVFGNEEFIILVCCVTIITLPNNNFVILFQHHILFRSHIQGNSGGIHSDIIGVVCSF